MSETAPRIIAGSRGPLPLVLGVTGHRQLRPEDRDALADGARRLLTTLLADYPHTPLCLVSPLAEGADRIVTQVALALHVPFVAALPMPADEYLRDFESDASKAEFRALLERATHRIVVPFDDDASRSASAGERERRYQAVGAWMVRRCQILIALWDGDPEGERPGGTAQIVRWQLEGVGEEFAPPRSSIDVAAVGPVWHVQAPRAGRTGAARPGHAEWKLPSTDDGGAFQATERAMYRRFDEYNAACLRHDASIRAARAKAREDFTAGVPPAVLSAEALELLDAYATADALALGEKRRVRHTMHVVFSLVFSAVVAFESFAHLADDRCWRLGLVVTYVSLFVAAGGLYMRSVFRADERRQTDFRALAEGLRVQLFWRIAGLRERASDRYLRLQRNELTWVREALLTVDTVCEAKHATSTVDLRERLRLVSAKWVEAEYRYFRTRGLQNAMVHHWLEWGARVLMIGALATAAANALARARALFRAGSCAETLQELGAAAHPVDTSVVPLCAAALALGVLAIARWRVEHARWREPVGRDRRARLRTCTSWGTVAVLAAFVGAVGWRADGLDTSGCAQGLVATMVVALAWAGATAGLVRVVAPANGARHEWLQSQPGTGVGVAAVLLLIATITAGMEHRWHFHAEHILIAATVIAFLAGALLRTYAEVRAYESEARRYETMEATFHTARQRLNHALATPDGLDRAARIVRELGEEALAESGDWLLLHRDRPLQMPAG